MRETFPLWACLPLRLFTAVAMVRAALSKIANHWLDAPRLEAVVRSWISVGKPPASYQSFLEHFVLPHAKLFSTLVVVGEMAVGGALLLGMFSRPAALVGLFMTLNFLLGQGESINA